MGKKALLASAFVAVALVSGLISGGMVLLFEMNQGLVKTQNASQEAIVEMVQTENEQVDAVQEEEMTFSCGVSGCTKTDWHSHSVCGVAGCTETVTHMHNGEYCYPHSANDGHAHNSCGVSGCTETGSHTHNSCGVSGCTESGDHSHDGNYESSDDGGNNGDGGHNGDSGNSGEHHQSSHGGGHH